MNKENEIKIDETTDQASSLEEMGEQVAPEMSDEKVEESPASDEQKADESEGEQQDETPMSITEAVQELTSVYVHKLIQLENAFGVNHGGINFEATTHEGRTFKVNVTIKRSNSASGSKENQMSKVTKKAAKKVAKKTTAKKAVKKAPAKKKAAKKVSKKK